MRVLRGRDDDSTLRVSNAKAKADLGWAPLVSPAGRDRPHRRRAFGADPTGTMTHRRLPEVQ